MTAHLTAALLDACAGCKAPKTIRRRLRGAGLDEAAAERLAPAVAEAARLRDERRARRSGADPLVIAAASRDWRLGRMKREAAIRSTAMFPAWRVDMAERVLRDARIGEPVSHEAALATLEAICREARRRGWLVRHTSKARSGRASSRYIVVPGRGEVRLSDHELPETAEREHKRLNGTAGQWNGEVVIGDEWRTVRLETWMRRVLLAADGRF